jgi:pyruvate/2-oxoglutarate dehydrogenase complex dihydrolipoamide dehydrogenase (E3) component
MELKEIPDHLLIIGGGYIGLEFGQTYCRFGSKVTILEFGNRFLSRKDEDIAEEVFKFMQEEGIDVFIDAQILK